MDPVTRIHIVLALLAVTVVLPASVLFVPNPPYRVHRAWIHIALQVLFAGLLIAAVVVLMPSFSKPPPIHGILGYTFLLVGLPLAMYSRRLSEKWHAVLGHGVALAAYGVSIGGTLFAYPTQTPMSWTLLAILGASLALYLVRLIVRIMKPRGIHRRGAAGQYGPLAKECEVEGSGWSFLLRRHWPTSSTLSTRPLAGRTPAQLALFSPDETCEWWGAGTTIAVLQRDLVARGLTLAAHPTLKGGTLGAWIATGAHGSGGTLWTPAFSEAFLVDREKNTVLRIRDPKRFSGFVQEPQRYIVVEVCIRPVDDVDCMREAFDIRNIEHARTFLSNPTYLRLIFVDAEASLAYIWRPLKTEDERSHPRQARIPPWLATLLPSKRSAKLPREEWRTRMRLSEANNFAPDPPMWSTWAMLWYLNFEVYASIPPTPNLLLGCCETLQRLFQSRPDLKGRCEIRCGKSIMIFDFAMRSRDHAPLIDALRSVLGPRVVFTLHRGKAQVDLEETVSKPMKLYRSK